MLTLSSTQGISFMRGIVWSNGWRWIFILVSGERPLLIVCANKKKCGC